jgi:nucleotide-binding universal stress UspA family protein
MEDRLKILVATDYSPAAKSAEKYAINLAIATGSFLIFIHVYEDRPADSHGDAIVTAGGALTWLSEYDKLSGHVWQLLQSEKAASEPAYQCVIKKGFRIRKLILQEALEREVDFVITGTHNRATLKEWMFGTHTWNINMRSRLPVLAIPEVAEFSEIKNIVYVTDYKKGEIPALYFLTRIAKWLGAKITVLFTTNEQLSEKFSNGLSNNFKEEIIDNLSYAAVDIHQYKINYRNVTNELNALCKKNEVNWIVMSHLRSSFPDNALDPPDENTLPKMTFHPELPFFVLPDFFNAPLPQIMKAI